MSTLLRRLRSLLRVARRDPQLVGIAARSYLLMVIARAVIVVLSQSQITRHLGRPMHETPVDGLSEQQMRFARRVGWVIARMAPHTPTTSNCYPQALAASYLLRRKQVPLTFYYGAAFEANGGELEAHTWVRCGPTIVTGGPVHRRFAVMSTYAWVPQNRMDADRSVSVRPVSLPHGRI